MFLAIFNSGQMLPLGLYIHKGQIYYHLCPETAILVLCVSTEADLELSEGILDDLYSFV